MKHQPHRQNAHVVHEVRGRIRLKVPPHHRSRAQMQEMRDWLHADLYDLVHSVTANPHTGSIVIHHSNHESFPESLEKAFLRFGLMVVLDDAIDIDGKPDNQVVSLSLLAASHGINWAIERAGWCGLQRVFFWTRLFAHVERVFAGGRLNGKALGDMIVDFGGQYGLALLLA